MQDSALLTQYAQNNSEAAFAQLLAKHLPLVYRTCRRELGSDTLAEDAAQVVFLLLARKAKTLRAGPSLAGWLYQTSVFVAKDIRKQEARRTRRLCRTTHLLSPRSKINWVGYNERVDSTLTACLFVICKRPAALERSIESHGN